MRASLPVSVRSLLSRLHRRARARADLKGSRRVSCSTTLTSGKVPTGHVLVIFVLCIRRRFVREREDGLVGRERESAMRRVEGQSERGRARIGGRRDVLTLLVEATGSEKVVDKSVSIVVRESERNGERKKSESEGSGARSISCHYLLVQRNHSALTMGAAASKQATKATRPLTSSLAQHQQPLPQATRAAPPPPPTTAQKTAQQQQQVSEDKSKGTALPT